MAEERSNYTIFRHDYLLLHTKPVTLAEARWLYQDAYSSWFVSREARARYLAEWGNVLDLGGRVERLSGALFRLFMQLENIYFSPEAFEEKLDSLLGREDLRPRDRQLLEEVAAEVRDFLRRPVEPRPLEESAVRYVEMMGPYVRREGRRYATKLTAPKAEWLAYAGEPQLLYGVSVFPDSFWLWMQYEDVRTHAVIVRRGASDEEVANAVARDDAVLRFVEVAAEKIKQIINKGETKLRDKGYGDVVGKTKMILAIAELMAAGRRREGEEEGVPA